MTVQDRFDLLPVNAQVHELRADEGDGPVVADPRMLCGDLRCDLIRRHHFEKVKFLDHSGRQRGPVALLFAPGGVGVGGLATEKVVEMEWPVRRAVVPAGVESDELAAVEMTVL